MLFGQDCPDGRTDSDCVLCTFADQSIGSSRIGGPRDHCADVELAIVALKKDARSAKRAARFQETQYATFDVKLLETTSGSREPSQTLVRKTHEILFIVKLGLQEGRWILKSSGGECFGREDGIFRLQWQGGRDWG